MIIDFRARPPSAEFLEYPTDPASVAEITARLGGEVPRAFEDRSISTWLHELASAGIDRAVVLGYRSPIRSVPNEVLARLQEELAETVIGFGFVDPMEVDPVGETERCMVELALGGIYIEPGLCFRRRPDDISRDGIYMTDPRMFGIYEKCVELDAPLIVLTGPYAGFDMSHTAPVLLDRVAALFPELKLVAGHGCWPYAAEILGVAYKRPNLFVSPDQYMFMPGAQPYVEALRNPRLARQLLFATNYPFRDFESTAEWWRRLDVPEESLRAALGGNAAKLLKLTEEPRTQ